MRVCDRATGIAILRPALASQAKLRMKNAAEGTVCPAEFERLTGTESVYDIQQAIRNAEALRDLIMHFARRAGMNVNIHELQLKRRESRDCYTTDLPRDDNDALLRSDVIAMPDPNLGQIRLMRRQLPCTKQHLLIENSDSGRIDDYVEDLGLNNITQDPHRTETVHNLRSRVHIVPHGNEAAIKTTFERIYRELVG